jgi:hypothetical protein
VRDYLDTTKGAVHGVSATFFAGLKPGEVSLGESQASWLGQFLARKLARTQVDRQKQAQECSAAMLHHRGLLETD